MEDGAVEDLAGVLVLKGVQPGANTFSGQPNEYVLLRDFVRSKNLTITLTDRRAERSS